MFSTDDNCPCSLYPLQDRVMGISRSRNEPAGSLHRFLFQMNLGFLFLESLSTGIITSEEMRWIASNQRCFNRIEAATALRLGRLLDSGLIQLGCRI